MILGGLEIYIVDRQKKICYIHSLVITIIL